MSSTGAFVYTQAASLPEELLPRLREATQKVNFDFDKDFTITDNTCQVRILLSIGLYMTKKILV